MPIPLSVLDLSPILQGGDAADALRNTVDLAQHAERWGYHRFWLAEHHFAALASSAPAVVIAQIAAATDRIRVGSAAVQLEHGSALAVVEAFSTLATLNPGRIDLGIGRSRAFRLDPGGIEAPPPTAADGAAARPPSDVLSGESRATPHAFEVEVDAIIAMIDGEHSVNNVGLSVVPTPAFGLRPWVFGSTRGPSACVAGTRGLPFVASYHITPKTALDAIVEYRNEFRPSRELREPYVVVSVDVVVAGDVETARYLASSYGHWVHSFRTGGAVPYPDPETVTSLTAEQVALVADRTSTQFVGDAEHVAECLYALQRTSGADELLVTSVTHRHGDRLRSYELLARRWGI